MAIFCAHMIFDVHYYMCDKERNLGGCDNALALLLVKTNTKSSLTYICTFCIVDRVVS